MSLQYNDGELTEFITDLVEQALVENPEDILDFSEVFVRLLPSRVIANFLH